MVPACFSSGCISQRINAKAEVAAKRQAELERLEDERSPHIALASNAPLLTSFATDAAGHVPKPQVRIVGFETDLAKRYSFVVPNLPVPPLIQWRRWFR